MIFNLKRVLPPIFHIVLCAIVLLLPLIVMSSDHDDLKYRFYFSYLIRTSLLIVLFYINYLFLINKLLFRKKIFEYIGINILLLVAVILLQNVFIDLFRVGPIEANNLSVSQGQSSVLQVDRERHMPPPYKFRLIGECVFSIFIIGMSVALRVTMRWYKDSLNLETIKASQLEADLKHLREQLNPHFLFNTLNNIYALIGIDTLKAQDSIHRLSGLLRYILYDNQKQLVSIDKELEFTQNYIDLMILRLSKDFKLEVMIQNNGCTAQIAPLMFITLIENAFKHGLEGGMSGFIDIKIFANKDNGILCMVSNSFNEEIKQTKESGIGLFNLKSRLELIYPKSHRFEISKKDGIFSVMLSINLKKYDIKIGYT